MAVGFDNSDGAAAASATSVTLSSFAVGAGADRLLVVSVGIEEPTEASTVVSDVTFNGSSITQVRREIEAGGNNSICEMWELLVPANTTADIVATAAGTCEAIKVNAMSFTGIKNQAFEAENGGSDNSDSQIPAGSTLTTATDSALMVVACHIGATGAWTAGTNFTLGTSNSGDGASLGDEYDLDAGTAGSKTVDMDKAGGNSRVAWVALSYELAAADGGRIMSSLANAGGLAGSGGIAGAGGGLAG